MRLLTDQDVYAATVQFLRGLGYDVATAAERSLSQSADTQLLLAAHAENRVLVTRDRDYGGLVFQQALAAGGVVSAGSALHTPSGACRIRARSGAVRREGVAGRVRGHRAGASPHTPAVRCGGGAGRGT